MWLQCKHLRYLIDLACSKLGFKLCNDAGLHIIRQVRRSKFRYWWRTCGVVWWQMNPEADAGNVGGVWYVNLAMTSGALETLLPQVYQPAWSLKPKFACLTRHPVRAHDAVSSIYRF